MRPKDVRWHLALGGAVAAAFAWVAIYSYSLHPGEPPAFYQQYALKASPWVVISLEIPVFYLVCRWIGSRAPSNALPTAMAFGFRLLFGNGR